MFLPITYIAITCTLHILFCSVLTILVVSALRKIGRKHFTIILFILISMACLAGLYTAAGQPVPAQVYEIEGLYTALFIFKTQ